MLRRSPAHDRRAGRRRDIASALSPARSATAASTASDSASRPPVGGSWTGPVVGGFTTPVASGVGEVDATAVEVPCAGSLLGVGATVLVGCSSVVVGANDEEGGATVVVVVVVVTGGSGIVPHEPAGGGVTSARTVLVTVPCWTSKICPVDVAS